MFKKCLFSATAILLLSSSGFASIGQAQSWIVAPSNWMVSTGSVGSGALASAPVAEVPPPQGRGLIGVIAFQYQTCTVGLQTQMSWCFYWPPCPHPWPPFPPPCKPSCTVRGGDATATATAVSYGGSAQASAHAVGGDAILVIK